MAASRRTTAPPEATPTATPPGIGGVETTIDQDAARELQAKAARGEPVNLPTPATVLLPASVQNVGRHDGNTVSVPGKSVKAKVTVTGVWGHKPELVVRLQTSASGNEGTWREIDATSDITEQGEYSLSGDVDQAKTDDGAQPGYVRVNFDVDGVGAAFAFSVVLD